ncbi:MAG: hypothetical protein JKY02_10750 [Flavobacteriaceae bacterium]|nr:hypothetical protein [Flavobacteriaceae bacterium]
MKLNYSKRTFSTYLLSLFVVVLTSSCTIYQNVPDDDGIYSSEKKKTRVIAENSNEHKEYEKNYFTKELEKFEDIDGSDVLTDIDNYSSINDSISEVTVNYTPQAWGYGDDQDIVININLNNGYNWGGGYWNYCNPYYGYGFYNSWYSQRNYWGWFYRGYRNRPYWGSYGHGGFSAYEYYRFRANSRYYAYSNSRYGRRGNTYSNRYASRNTASNSNSIYSRSRRASTTNTRISSVYRRGSQTIRGRNSTTTKPTSRSKPRISRGNSNTSNTRGNTNTRSRSGTRSRVNRSSTRSSSRSRGSSARSSSRSSSSRGSSSRGSSSRGSSRKKG